MNYEQACSEMNFILNNLNSNDLQKIPKRFIEFFSENMDKNYQVNISLNKPLYEQELLEETKAFIKIIELNYFTSQENRAKKIIELGLEDVPEDNTYENLFKNNTSLNNTSNSIKEETTNQDLGIIEYKSENKIIRFIKNLINRFIKC